MTKGSPIAQAAGTTLPHFERTDALAGLVKEIRRAHADVQRGTRSILESARAAGEGLIELKAMVPHGEWTARVEKACGFSLRTSQVYLQLARNWDTLDLAKAQRAALLSLRDAVDYLRPVKKPPVEAADQLGRDLDVGAPGRVEVQAAPVEPELKAKAISTKVPIIVYRPPKSALAREVQGEVVEETARLSGHEGCDLDLMIDNIGIYVDELEVHAQGIAPKQMARIRVCRDRLGELVEPKFTKRGPGRALPTVKP